MMTFKELVLLILPFIIIGVLVWLHAVGCVNFLKWYRDIGARKMGMTIDEAIIQSRIQLTIWEEGCTSKLDNSPKAIETLIEIAQKYQKIERIVKEWDDSGLLQNQLYDKICEAVEDENNL